MKNVMRGSYNFQNDLCVSLWVFVFVLGLYGIFISNDIWTVQNIDAYAWWNATAQKECNECTFQNGMLPKRPTEFPLTIDYKWWFRAFPFRSPISMLFTQCNMWHSLWYIGDFGMGERIYCTYTQNNNIKHTK